jgi:hypothetical protein
MGTVFSLSNDGLLPIHDIETTCGVDEVRNQFGGGVSGTGCTFPESHADILSPGQKMALPCARAVLMTSTASAHITILATYRPDFVWWHRTITFPMEAEKADDGTWLWKRLPQ